MEENHQITLTEWIEMKEAIRRELNNVKHAFVRVGYYLRRAEDEKLYLQDGYSSLAEFAQKEYGLTATTVSRFMSINRKYSVDGYSAQLLPEYQDYKQSVLTEMLALPDSDLQMVTPETPREDVRELARFNRQQPAPEVSEELTDMICNFFLDNPEVKQELLQVMPEGITEGIAIEILNPSGNRTYRKGMFFMSMTEKDIKIKKFGGVPQTYTYMEFVTMAEGILAEMKEEERERETQVHEVPGEAAEETQGEPGNAAEDPGDRENDPGTEADDLQDGRPDQEPGGADGHPRTSPDGDSPEGEGAGNAPAEDGEGEPEPQEPVAPAQFQEEKVGGEVPKGESGEGRTEGTKSEEPVSVSESATDNNTFTEELAGTVEDSCDRSENTGMSEKVTGSQEKCPDHGENDRITEKDAPIKEENIREENNGKPAEGTADPVEGMMNPPEPAAGHAEEPGPEEELGEPEEKDPAEEEHTEPEIEETGITHNLKIRSEFFQAVNKGTKTFELRKDDRNYQVGDRILLMEFEEGRFTGNTLKKTITYKLAGFDGLQPGYCILAIQ